MDRGNIYGFQTAGETKNEARRNRHAGFEEERKKESLEWDTQL
jgi:hypothetical protein